MQYTINNEEEAVAVFYALQQRYGWAGGIITRAHAARLWEEVAEDWNEPIDMTDEDWDRLQRTHDWGLVLTDYFNETVEDTLRSAIQSAILSNSH